MLIPRIITVFIFLLTLNCNVIFSQSQASQTETKQETTEIESKKEEIADKKIVSLLIISWSPNRTSECLAIQPSAAKCCSS